MWRTAHDARLHVPAPHLPCISCAALFPAVLHCRYPTGGEVQQYIERYAADAGLLPLITFGAAVSSVAPVLNNGHTLASADGADGWEVSWTDGKG